MVVDQLAYIHGMRALMRKQALMIRLTSACTTFTCPTHPRKFATCRAYMAGQVGGRALGGLCADVVYFFLGGRGKQDSA
jgi:hypothetical protein